MMPNPGSVAAQHGRSAGKHSLTRGKRLFLLGWGCCILALYLLIGGGAFLAIRGERWAVQESIRLRMTPGLVEPGLNPPAPIPETGSFIPVTIGIYLDDVETISIRDSFWAATFYVWFRWAGDRDLNPGANFHLINANVVRKELQSERYGPDGRNYQRYRVTARMTKFFNATRVPRDSHQLNITVEDTRLNVSRLRYIADPGTGISPRVRIPGYEVTPSANQAVKVHTYLTTYGDPENEGQEAGSYSNYVYGVDIARNGLGTYLKIFMGLFAGMALCLTSFRLRASDASPRLSMVVGSYFGTVANTYVVSALVPPTNQFGLIEYVNFAGLFTIFFSLLATLASIHFWTTRQDKPLSRAFDNVTLAVAGTAYVALNIALPLAA